MKWGIHSETMHVPKPVDTILVQGSTVYGDCNKVSLVILIQMVQSDLKVSGSALINSGVQGNFIDKWLVGSSGLKTEAVRVSVTCLISNVVPNPCSRPKPTETRGHVI